MLNKLSARRVETIKKPGRHSDGGNLYLVVDEGGNKRWVFLFRWRGRLREMGLGSVNAVTLLRAREKAAEARALVADDIDPIKARKIRRAAAAAAEAKAITFGDFADSWLPIATAKLKNENHLQQWRRTFKTQAVRLRPMLVSEITTADVLPILEPIWVKTPEAARRLRNRLERAFSAAEARGLRVGKNPAAWGKNLDAYLGDAGDAASTHFASMPWKDVPAFAVRLRAANGLGALALEFLILTAGRTGEVIGARWAEMDLNGAVWTVPAERMKMGNRHRVPLSPRAVAILREAEKVRCGDYVFPAGEDRPFSNMVFAMLLRRLHVTGATPHGFRSSFRTWVFEETDFPRDLAEVALAHGNEDKVEAAYRRGDALEKRRAMMAAWADFIEPRKADNVTPMRRRGGKRRNESEA